VLTWDRLTWEPPLRHPISPNAYMRQETETSEAHRLRMAKEMAGLRRQLAADNGGPFESPAPVGSHRPPLWPALGKSPRSSDKREAVLNRIRNAQRASPQPTVAISYRGGFGYDAGTFSKGKTRATVVSSPSGFEALPRDAPKPDIKRRETEAIDARKKAIQAHQDQLHHLTVLEDSGADSRAREQALEAFRPQHLMQAQLGAASGLYIPGGQDIPKEGSDEQVTREAYEQAAVRTARNMGMPTLAICGGSRALARAFGGTDAPLSAEALKVHSQQGTAAMSHGLKLVPHTILGGVRGGTVDKINSTHKKVADLRSVPILPATGERELQVSATDGDVHPEGFETTHGAPIVGVTSHPEAIHGASSDAQAAATPQGREWSDRVLRGFEQSMKTYAARQQVNADIRKR
jgi:gamma-glutamyl-gamma-aminobutyrate hydrolase PuuD